MPFQHVLHPTGAQEPSANDPLKPPGASELALILAAERLFAERGIAVVSLREINQAANQKNIAAAHYHFGSREGLVKAVLMHRWPRLDRRRGELLERSGRPQDLRFLLEAFILPLAEELAPRSEGNHYLRFIRDYERLGADYQMAQQVSPAGVEIFRQFECCLAWLPESIRAMRIGYVINLMHSILAKAEEQLARGEIRHADIDLITSNMIDMFVDALGAPLSAGTVELLAGQ